jgi:sulfide:quinone oxidoreductase
MGFMDTDHGTLQAKGFENMYVIGDATNVPTSKSGAVAHYESDVVVGNIIREIEGQPPRPDFDGHST